MDNGKRALDRLMEGTVIPAHPLALNGHRQLDEKRQRALSKYYLSAGAGGLAVGVHTTQFEIRRPEHALFEPVLQMAAEEIKSYEKNCDTSIVMIAGVCGSEKQAAAEAETARKMGYDAVLLSPGGLSDLTEVELLKRTRTVASILPVVGFYLQPSVGGRVFTYDYWQRFCEIETVIAIKCAAFNRYQTLDVVRAAAFSSRSEQIALYTGNDDNIVIDLLTQYEFQHEGRPVTKRFVGGLLGHWAVWTRATVTLFNEINQAVGCETIPAYLLTIAAQITDTNAAFFDTAHHFAGCIAGIHEVLRRQGLLEGIWCLNPKEGLSPGQAKEIDRVYRMYPHLNDDEFVRSNLKNWGI